MQHSGELIETAEDEARIASAKSQSAPADLKMLDRTTPRWAMAVALTYNSFTSLIFFGVATAPLFLLSMVAVDGQQRFAPMMVLGLLVPLLGTVLIDFAYRWSMSGMKDVRTAVSDRSLGIIGVLATAALTFVQPYFLIPIVISLALSVSAIEALRRFDRDEGAWDFRKEEAISFLSGRDDFGFQLAITKRQEHSLAVSVHRFGTALSGLSGFALGSWLVTQNILTLEAVAALSFISMLITDMILRAARSFAFADVHHQNRTTLVRSLTADSDTDELNPSMAYDRLAVAGLTVTETSGRRLMDDVSFDVMPGSIVQITGASGDGKSLLLRALTDPFSIENCEIQGRVTFGGVDFWDRRASMQTIPAVRVDPCPSLLPASALDNITCFQPEMGAERANAILRKIVYSQDILDRMTSDTVHAPELPMMQQKVLGLVRAFLLSPQVLLLDCPEAFLPERQIGQVVDLLKSQARLGRIAILVTDNRALMEICDKVLVLQGGRVVDYGDGTEIRARHGSGWRRFTGKRRLDTEEALHSWLRSQFIRDGDEGNRRRVCKIGSNILAHFCLTSRSDDEGDITFECKQKAGAMELRVSDDKEPISTIQFEQARQLAEDPNVGVRLTPLAHILKDGKNIQTESRFGTREIFLEVSTYDPRKVKDPQKA